MTTGAHSILKRYHHVKDKVTKSGQNELVVCVSYVDEDAMRISFSVEATEIHQH